MIGLVLKAIASRLLSAATALFGIIGRHPWQAACLALLCASAIHWHGKREAITQRDQARTELATIIKRGKVLAKQAERITKASKELANETDRKTVVTVTRFRDRVVRLPSANSVCATLKDSGPQSGVGPGIDSVVLSRSDANICAINTGRMAEVQPWAVKLEELQEAELPVIY